MNLNSAFKKYITITDNIENRQIKDAFDGIRIMANEVNNESAIDKVEGLETNYKYMLHYFIAGNDDPQRNNVYNHMVREIYKLADNLLAQYQLKESYTIFYEKSRVANIHQPVNIDDYINIFVQIKDDLSITDLMPDGEEKNNKLRKAQIETEKTSRDMFYSIFISQQSNNGDSENFKKFLVTTNIPVTTKSMMISALTLNILQKFDRKKIELLLDICSDEEVEVAVRAIVGLIPILRKYQNRWKYYPTLKSRMELLTDDHKFVRMFMKAILQFIQAHETERITKKLTEEILPEMMKLSPMIGKKINLEEWMGESGLEDKNPEWQKILDETGLSDKLKEFSELQLGGADIFHSTFSNLKRYPFFNEMSNWFVPFDKNHSAFQTMFDNKTDADELLSSMLTSSMMCNSDKYSLCFSILQMPEEYRKMMISQLGAEGEELKQMAEEEFSLNPLQKEDAIFKQYVQDLYRFYKLYSRKGDFDDIFASSLDFHKIAPVESITSEAKNLNQIALHYFEKNNFNEALEAYIMLAEKGAASGETWQKIGYCKQIKGDIKGALTAYQKAELIDENNSWLIRRIGACYRMIKEPESALQYYRRLEQLKPDDLNVQINIGHCFLELKQYEEALNYYFKVDFISNGNTRAWRSIAWCSFLSKKFDTAQKYYKQIIENKPNANDYLNAGHVELCLDNKEEAVAMYSESAKMTGGDFNDFIALLEDDIPELKEAGVDISDLPLIIDNIRYKSISLPSNK